MPGVKVETSVRSGPAAPLRIPSGQYFVSGMTERGRVDKPITVRGIGDYLRQCGGRVGYGALYDDLRMFFEEGGAIAHIARVVGPAATVGALTLMDAAAVPVATLRIDAANPGAWSAGLTVEVTNNATEATFSLIIRLDGALVERFDNIPNPTTAALRLLSSEYVRGTDLGSTTAAPANNPATRAAAALSAGTDDRAAATAAMYAAALARFPVGMGDGIVAIPGQAATTSTGTGSIGTALSDHARANRRIAALASPRGTDENSLRANAASFPSEHVGMFGPWVQIPDGTGGTRTISPEGFVAAKRSLAHEIGPWRAPGGEIGRARFITGLDQNFTAVQGDALDAGRVSVIREVSGSIRLYGWRSTSRDEQNFGLLTGQDTVNRVVVEGEARLEPFVFEPVDGRGQLLSRIEAEMIGMLEPIRAAGGLYPTIAADGSEVDPGYAVNTGPEVNTTQVLSRNEVRVDIALRVAPTAALITYSIVKVALTAAL